MKTWKLKVNVRRKHIEQGVCDDPKNCAVARALLDKTSVSQVDVFGAGDGFIRVKRKGGRWFACYVPDNFIDRFDLREERSKLKPLSFVLKLKEVA